MTVSKSGTTRKILQYLAEPSKVFQKCCSCRFLWNWANTVNLCAALKTESLFSLVFYRNKCRHSCQRTTESENNTQFLSLAYTLLRLSSLSLRYSKLVSTGMYELLRSSKMLLQNVLVHKSKAQNYFAIVE